MSAEATLRRIESLRLSGGGMSDDDIAWLITCFDHAVKAVQRRAGEALAAAAAGGCDIELQLRVAAERGSLRRRWAAVWTLARIGDVPESVLPLLFTVMGTADGDLRWAAARIVVQRVQCPDLAEQLRRLLDDGNAEQRKMATYCLRDLGRFDDAALALHRRSLGDPNHGVRLAAMATLVRHAAGDGEVAEAFLDLLADREPGVRRAAAASLGRLGVRGPEIIRRLRDAAADEDAILARAARQALDRLGD
jgi:HEAT repeat protein